MSNLPRNVDLTLDKIQKVPRDLYLVILIKIKNINYTRVEIQSILRNNLKI